MSVTALDIGVLIIVFLSAILAMVRGFSREVLSVASWAAAAAAAYFFYPQVMPFLKPYIANETFLMVAAIALVFLVTLIVVSLITMKISDAIIDSSIGVIDRTLGFLFGAARGILLVVIAMMFFTSLTPEKDMPVWIKESRSKPYLDNLSAQLQAALPENLDEFVPSIVGEDTKDATGEAPQTNAPSPESDALKDLLKEETAN